MAKARSVKAADAPVSSEGLVRAEKLLRAGKLDEMDQVCRALLEKAPNAAEAHRFLGLAEFMRGRFPEAEAHVRRALALQADLAAAHDNLSLYLLRMGRPVEAEAAARRALSFQPNLANASHNLGLALRAQRRFAEAEPPLREAIVLAPNDAEVWNDLAAVMEQLHRVPESAVALKRALQLRPDFSLAKQNLQRVEVLLSELKKPGGSENFRAQPLAGDHSSAAEENNLGVELLAQGRLAAAEAAFRRASRLAPELAEIWFNIGKALQGQEKLAEAEEYFLRAVKLRPAWAEAYVHLGFLQYSQRRLKDAEAAYRRALGLQPDHVEALNSLAANILTNQGRFDEARKAYQHALALEPAHSSCHSNFLLNEQYSPGVTLAGIAGVHAEWERRHAAPLRSTWGPFTQTRDPDRPLRLGFVSGDFYYHPVGVFLAPVLERLDRKNWFTVCYASQSQNDKLTTRLKNAAGLWQNVYDLGNDALAERIGEDQIDLLFDLSGHTGRNRLLTFARRPAPVQLTWMGYVGTTGLSAMDYLIADRFHVPGGFEAHYREKVLRMPDSYLCFEPPAYAPPVGPLPALAAGHVTFGCLNNTAKINPAVVEVWAEIMRRVPSSRLVLKYHWLDDEGLRKRLSDLFAAQHIAPERLELLGSTPHGDQLRQYNRIDLALDPFPYSGGLTTLEACWMGAPVLTCPGDTFAGRHSFSYLSNIGITETVAANLTEYVDRAVNLAGDLKKLAELRRGLRPRMAGAPVCDLDRFATHFTDAVRKVWTQWCDANG